MLKTQKGTTFYRKILTPISLWFVLCVCFWGCGVWYKKPTIVCCTLRYMECMWSCEFHEITTEQGKPKTVKLLRTCATYSAAFLIIPCNCVRNDGVHRKHCFCLSQLPLSQNLTREIHLLVVFPLNEWVLLEMQCFVWLIQSYWRK